MNWAEERWVKLYTRNTPDLAVLSWRARGLLWELLRVVDRRGALALGRTGKRGVAAILGALHEWVDLEKALDELIADGCVSIEGDTLILPNFEEAQEARTSDAARQRTRREKKAATESASHDVTRGHAPSHGVTPHHEQNRTEENRREEQECAAVADALPAAGRSQTQPAAPIGSDAATSAAPAVASRPTPPVLTHPEPKPPRARRTERPKADPEAEEARRVEREAERVDAERWKVAFCRATGTPLSGPGCFSWGDAKNKSSTFFAFRTARDRIRAQGGTVDDLIRSTQALATDAFWRKKHATLFLAETKVAEGLAMTRVSPPPAPLARPPPIVKPLPPLPEKTPEAEAAMKRAMSEAFASFAREPSTLPETA